MLVKRFDETPYYKCDFCQNYWNSSCDGTEVGEVKDCSAYKVTRTGEWKKELEELREAVSELLFLKAMCFISCVLALIGIFH